MPGATLLRALRVRGPMSPANCKAVLSNSRDRLGRRAAARCRHYKGKIMLRAERDLLKALPVHLVALPRELRVLYHEQAHRLAIKRGPDGLLSPATPLNAVCKKSLTLALGKLAEGALVTTVVAEYPAAHADLLTLCKDGKAVIVGDRCWTLHWPAAVPGAAEAWLESSI